jgi:esterase/lipase
MIFSLGRSSFILLCSCWLIACSSGFSSAPTSIIDDTTTDTFTKTVLSTSSYNDGTNNHDYDLLKVQSGNKDPSFMQWIPNSLGTTGPTVIIYYPYEGIDWTGLAIDTKWSARSGAQNDEDAPFYDVATSSQISYTLMSHNTAAVNNSYFMLNNIHTLIVYGRYYAGTNVTGDVQAVADGYKFLASQSLVDKTKIGIYSGSWGGLGVLYGTAAAIAEDTSIMPKAISLAYPVSDVKLMVNYLASIPTLTAVQAKIDAYNAFFDPYSRRIEKATEELSGQATQYDKFTQSKLAGITSDMFIIHDDWDTLVPVGLTHSLLSTVASTDKYVYYQKHATAMDYDNFVTNHSQAANPVDYATALSWNYLFLISELTDSSAPRAAGYSSSALLTQFDYMVSMHTGGKDTSDFAKVLSLMCRPNLFLHDVDNVYGDLGASFILHVIMERYQVAWSTDATDACAKIISSPPFQ